MSVNKANQISGALKEEEEDQSQHQLQPFTMATAEAPSSFHTSNLFKSSNIVQETTTIELSEFSEHHHQQRCDLLSLEAKKYSDIISNDQSSETISNAPIKWMSSKMRLMRKMMAQQQITMNKSKGKLDSVFNAKIKSENITSSGAVIRVCSICNTTKTPLWRSGPQGPKSLCNACGIRQMKARRAAATSIIQINKDMIVKKEKKFNGDRTIPYKKRYKFDNHDVDHQKLKFGDSSFGLRESSSSIFHPTFPQDENDAAILLMTLSFG